MENIPVQRALGMANEYILDAFDNRRHETPF
jgi:hypothetical protein